MNKFFNFMFFAAAAGILAAGTASAADENRQDSTPPAADSQITQNNDGTYTVTTTNGNTVTKTKYNSRITTINCVDTKLKCVKAVREITGMGLKEAKEYVDANIRGDWKLDLSKLDKKYAEGICSSMGIGCSTTEYYNTKTRFTPPEASVFMTDDGNNSVTITF